MDQLPRPTGDGQQRLARLTSAQILMAENGRFLALECKNDTGRLTEEQAAFLERVKRHGGVSGMVRGR